MFYVVRSTFSVRPMYYTGDEDRWTADPHHAARFEGVRVCEAALREVAGFVHVDVLTLKFQTIYDAEADTAVFNDRNTSKVRVSYRGFNIEFTREQFDSVLTDESGTDAAYNLAEMLSNADTLFERHNRVKP